MERKAIINGKIYDTQTANRVCGWDNGKYVNDFYYRSFDLYVTKKGQFFAVGDVDADLELDFKNGIALLTKKEAQTLAEIANISEETFALYFGEVEIG